MAIMDKPPNRPELASVCPSIAPDTPNANIATNIAI
jgi:hypothetical protein